MFETMHGFLFFFIPMCVAIILGIIFEEKLIAFEQRLKARLSARRRATVQSRSRTQLSKVQESASARSKTTRRNAA